LDRERIRNLTVQRALEMIEEAAEALAS